MFLARAFPPGEARVIPSQKNTGDKASGRRLLGPAFLPKSTRVLD